MKILELKVEVKLTDQGTHTNVQIHSKPCQEPTANALAEMIGEGVPELIARITESVSEAMSEAGIENKVISCESSEPINKEE